MLLLCSGRSGIGRPGGSGRRHDSHVRRRRSSRRRSLGGRGRSSRFGRSLTFAGGHFRSDGGRRHGVGCRARQNPGRGRFVVARRPRIAGVGRRRRLRGRDLAVRLPVEQAAEIGRACTTDQHEPDETGRQGRPEAPLRPRGRGCDVVGQHRCRRGGRLRRLPFAVPVRMAIRTPRRQSRSGALSPTGSPEWCAASSPPPLRSPAGRPGRAAASLRSAAAASRRACRGRARCAFLDDVDMASRPCRAACPQRRAITSPRL